MSDVHLFKKQLLSFFMSSSKILVSPAGIFRGAHFSSLWGGMKNELPAKRMHALEATKISELKTGTLNENIVQKHLNTALLNVF